MTLGPGLLGVHGETYLSPPPKHYPQLRRSIILSGARHRKQRKMLNPVFSIKHMREMIPIFYDVAHRVHP